MKNYKKEPADKTIAESTLQELQLIWKGLKQNKKLIFNAQSKYIRKPIRNNFLVKIVYQNWLRRNKKKITLEE